MDDDLRLTIEVARGDLVHRLESLPGPKHLLVSGFFCFLIFVLIIFFINSIFFQNSDSQMIYCIPSKSVVILNRAKRKIN